MSVTKITNDPSVRLGPFPHRAEQPKAAKPDAPLTLSDHVRSRTSDNVAQLASIIEPIGKVIDTFKSQLDGLVVEYPPFFPSGSTQRIYLIDRVNGTVGDIEELLATEKKGLSESSLPRLAGHASDEEVAGMITSLIGLRGDLAQRLASARAHKVGNETDRGQPATSMNVEV
jgi:hypothetical protein